MKSSPSAPSTACRENGENKEVQKSEIQSRMAAASRGSQAKNVSDAVISAPLPCPPTYKKLKDKK